MSYRVRIESFEGPFDLLLYLVSRQKVDIGVVSIAEITDQYLEEISHMKLLDLDVASDFLLVASTLLEIKAASLIPTTKDDLEEEFEELAPSQARDILVDRLIAYKQFKNASVALNARYVSEGRRHNRHFGPDPSLLTLVPDYLEGISLDTLAYMCAEVAGHKDPFLLDSDHIASKPIPVELHVRSIHSRIQNAKKLRFSDLITAQTQPAIIVVTFLAILELYKRNMILVSQPTPFGDIEMSYIEGSGDLLLEGDDAVTSDTGSALNEVD